MQNVTELAKNAVQPGVNVSWSADRAILRPLAGNEMGWLVETVNG